MTNITNYLLINNNYLFFKEIPDGRMPHSYQMNTPQSQLKKHPSDRVERSDGDIKKPADSFRICRLMNYLYKSELNSHLAFYLSPVTSFRSTHQRLVNGTDTGVGQSFRIVGFTQIKSFNNHFQVKLLGIFIEALSRS